MYFFRGRRTSSRRSRSSSLLNCWRVHMQWLCTKTMDTLKSTRRPTPKTNTKHTQRQRKYPGNSVKCKRWWNRRYMPLSSQPFSSMMKSLIVKTHSLVIQSVARQLHQCHPESKGAERTPNTFIPVKEQAVGSPTCWSMRPHRVWSRCDRCEWWVSTSWAGHFLPKMPEITLYLQSNPLMQRPVEELFHVQRAHYTSSHCIQCSAYAWASRCGGKWNWLTDNRLADQPTNQPTNN